MDELDLRLRAMAHGEELPLPPDCEALLERLEGEIRRGEDRRPRRRLGRRALLLAAAAAVLSASVLAAELWHLRIEEISVGTETFPLFRWSPSLVRFGPLWKECLKRRHSKILS